MQQSLEAKPLGQANAGTTGSTSESRMLPRVQNWVSAFIAACHWWPAITSDWAKTWAPDRVHRDLKLLHTEVVAQCLATFSKAVSPLEGDVRQVGSPVGALSTVSVATEGVPACVPAAHHTPRPPCRVRARRTHRGAVCWHCTLFSTHLFPTCRSEIWAN